MKHKEIKIDYHAKNWLYVKRVKHKRLMVCADCMYLTLKAENRVGCTPVPYCTFYDVFLHKVKPKRNIYEDRCPTHQIDWGKHVPIKTSEGYVSEFDITKDFKVRQNKGKKFYGIKNSEFKSKRNRGEPIVILKDVFAPTL